MLTSGDKEIQRVFLKYVDSRTGKSDESEVSLLAELRKAVLINGLSDATNTKDQFGVSLRGRVWKALLLLGSINANTYLGFVKKGKCIDYNKIRGDTFRTFPKNELFHSVVNEPSMVRLLNSFVLYTRDHHSSPDSFRYLQGLNAISAPFLFLMPEVDSFYSFVKFITDSCPLYWVKSLSGVHAGCKLVEECLKIFDSKLYSVLKKEEPHFEVFTFAPLTTFSMCLPPFTECLKLWDFYMCFGPHLNVICVTAQLVLYREQLLKAEGRENVKIVLNYRKWPEIHARVIISLTMSLLSQIPSRLYEKIWRHTFDPDVVSEIIGKSVKYIPPTSLELIDRTAT